MQSHLESVADFESARRKSGLWDEEDQEWSDEQQEFYGLRSQMLQMRAYPRDEVDWKGYANAVDHRKKMPVVPMPRYIGAGWTFFGTRGQDGPGMEPGQVVSGRVNGIAYDPANPTTFWVASCSGGVYRTTDNGGNYSGGLSDTWDFLYTSDIEIDPTNSNRVYVACGDYPGGWGYGIGIMRSTNGGSSWTNELRTLSDGAEVSDIWIDPDSTNILLAAAGRGDTSGTGAGLYRSVDYGQNWSRVTDTDVASPSSTGFSKITSSIGVGGARHIYLADGSAGGVYLSDDHGATWSALKKPNITRNGMTTVAASTVNINTLYAYVARDGQEDLAAIYRGTVSGSSISWANITGTLGSLTGTGSDGVGNDFRQVDYNYAFGCINSLASGAGTDCLIFGSVDLFALTSAQSSTNWRWINTSLQGRITHADHHGFCQHPTSKNKALVSNDGGIWEVTYNLTFNTFSFTNKNVSLRVSEHTSFDVHPNASLYPNTCLTGLWHNGTAHCTTDPWVWRSRAGADGMNATIHDLDPNIQYATAQSLSVDSTSDIGFYATNDGWASQTTLKTPPLSGDTFAFVTPTDESPTQAGAMWFAGENVYKMFWTGGAAGWLKGLGGSVASEAKEVATAIDVFVHIDEGIYVGTNFGTFLGSLDAADPLATLHEFGAAVSCVSTHPSVDEAVLVAVGNGSKSGGGTGLWECTNVFAASPVWVDRSGTGSASLPTIGVNWVCRDIYDPTHTWYAATDMGVFYTEDRGAHWYNATESLGLPNATVTQLKISDNYLYASSFGRGMYRMALRPAQPKVTSFNIVETEDTGGNLLSGTVTLDASAPPGGSQVTITSNLPSAIPTQTVTVPQGQTTYSFTISTEQTLWDAFVTVTATAGTGSDSDTVTLREVNVSSVLAADQSAGETGWSVWVAIDRAAPLGGAQVSLSSNSSYVVVPSTVTIPQGATGAFATNCACLARPTDLLVTITATRNSKNVQDTMTVLGVKLVSLALNPSSVWNTQPFTVTATLNRAAPNSNYVVSLASLNTAAATVPATVTVTDGNLTGSTQGNTLYVANDVNVTVRATDWSVNYDRTLGVKHIGISSLTVSPNPIVGGNLYNGVVTLDRNVGSSGVNVSLTSSNPSVLNVPSGAFVMANNTSAGFLGATATVPDVTDVVVTGVIGTQQVGNAFAHANVRVLPATVVVAPSSLVVNLGQLASGTVAGYAAVDGNSVRVCKAFVPNFNAYAVTVQLDGSAPIGSCTAAKLRVNSRLVTGGNYTQVLDVWDWSTGAWGTADTRSDLMTLSFVSRELAATSPTGWLRSDGALKARYRVKQTGFGAVFVWCHEVDEAVWVLTP